MKATINILKTIIPIFFLTLQLNAQEREQRKFAIGIHATPTYSITYFKNAEIYGDEYKPIMGCIAGISGQFNFSRRVALHMELNFERTGYTFIPGFRVYDFIHITPYYGPALSKTILTNNSITLPISLKFNFVSRTNIRVFANAGTFINYIYSYDMTSYYVDGEKKQMHDTRSSKLGNNYDPGALLGIGTDITLCKNIHLTLEARDHLNLRDIRFRKSNALGLLSGLTYEF